MNKTHENQIMWEQFVMESPWLTPALDSRINDEIDKIDFRELKKTGKSIGRYKDYDIIQLESLGVVKLYFVTDVMIAAYYGYIPREDGGTQTKLSWNDMNHKGVFLDIFANYLIPRFKVIESDSMMTPKAFDFWTNLMTLCPNNDYYVKSGNILTKLDNPYSIHFYKEPFQNENSTFVVSQEH